MTDAELLELALCRSIPRRDVRPTAESLLARFGSISGVFDASAGELCEIAGIGEGSALLLGLIGSLRDIAGRRPVGAQDRLTVPALRELVLTRIRDADRDMFFAVYLDRDGGVAFGKSVTDPLLSSPERLCGILANQASLTDCPDLILAHRISSSGPIPDREFSLAHALRRGLGFAGVKLLDYIIVSPGEYTSLAERLLSHGAFPGLPTGRPLALHDVTGVKK